MVNYETWWIYKKCFTRYWQRINWNRTGKEYFIYPSKESDGVNFDIAVTVIDSKTESKEASAKAGFVQVLGAGVEGKIENKEESSKVSRIQFAVYVPRKTKA